MSLKSSEDADMSRGGCKCGTDRLMPVWTVRVQAASTGKCLAKGDGDIAIASQLAKSYTLNTLTRRVQVCEEPCDWLLKGIFESIHYSIEALLTVKHRW